MKNIGMPHVIVIVAFLACITTLVALDRDTGALLAVGATILAGMGLQLGQTIAVKENTNGNQTKTLEMLQANQAAMAELAHKMGTMYPAPAAVIDIPVSPAAGPAAEGEPTVPIPPWTADPGRQAA